MRALSVLSFVTRVVRTKEIRFQRNLESGHDLFEACLFLFREGGSQNHTPWRCSHFDTHVAYAYA